MAEGTDNVEDRLSCDDSTYDEHNLDNSDSGNGVCSGSEDKEYVAVWTRWEWSLTSLNQLPPYKTLRAVAARTPM